MFEPLTNNLIEWKSWDDFLNYAAITCSSKEVYPSRWGYTPAVWFNSWISEQKSIWDWVEENLEGKVDYLHACNWFFELERDAVMFKLRWG